MLVIKQLQPNSQKLPTVSRKKQEVKKFFELAPGVSGGVQKGLLEQCWKDPGRSDGLDIINNHCWLLNTGSKMTSDL